jgi:hypothetical protein
MFDKQKYGIIFGIIFGSIVGISFLILKIIASQGATWVERDIVRNGTLVFVAVISAALAAYCAAKIGKNIVQGFLALGIVAAISALTNEISTAILVVIGGCLLFLPAYFLTTQIKNSFLPAFLSTPTKKKLPIVNFVAALLITAISIFYISYFVQYHGLGGPTPCYSRPGLLYCKDFLAYDAPYGNDVIVMAFQNAVGKEITITELTAKGYGKEVAHVFCSNESRESINNGQTVYFILNCGNSALDGLYGLGDQRFTFGISYTEDSQTKFNRGIMRPWIEKKEYTR